MTLKAADRAQVEADLRTYKASKAALAAKLSEYAEAYPPPSWSDKAPRVSGTNFVQDLTPKAVMRLLRDREYLRLKRLVAAIERVYERLDLQQRRVMELAYWEGWADEDVAAACNVSERTVERRKVEICLQALAEFQLSGIDTYRNVS